MNPTQTQSVSSSTVTAPSCFEFDVVPDVAAAFSRFSHLNGCLLLDSSAATKTSAGKPLGRFSFLTAEPIEKLVFGPSQGREGLQKIRSLLKRFQSSTLEGLPPFQGGIAGLLGYDLNRAFENLPEPSNQSFQLPALVFGVYDWVIAWDHEQDRAWVISHGMASDEWPERGHYAEDRIEWVRCQLNSEPPRVCNPTIASDGLPNTHPVPGPAGLRSNFSKEDYLASVQQAIDYIHAGDVFQINFAQQLFYQADCPATELYQRLRERNPAPFAGYYDLGDAQLVSASPERLISVRHGKVETRPIKGTRKRMRYPEVDLHSKSQLKGSEKDRAENTMIVDLMRNDLSRVCVDDSVRVTQLCELETYESVLHLVSAIEADLRPECDAVDLIEAVFPGGSITGAPKIRAMEIITELEKSSRGAYCGSLGYMSFDGSVDFNILIRTITAKDGWWQIPVGGGIVSQSDPEKEYEETWTKAAGMLRALTV